MRITTRDSHQIVAPKEIPFQTDDWYHVANGGKFKYKKLSRDRHGILMVDRFGQRALLHIENEHLHITPHGGQTQKIPLGPMDAHFRMLDPRGALAKQIDNPGAWTGDDDLQLKERSFPEMGHIMVPGAPDSSHFQPLFTSCPNSAANGDCDNGGGGDGFGDSGGGGGGGGGNTGGGGDTGGGGKPSAKPSAKVSCPPGTKMSAQCYVDLANLAAAVLVLIGSGIGVLAICITTGEFTLGWSCVAAIVALSASNVTLAAAWGAYANDNCPVPKKTGGCT